MATINVPVQFTGTVSVQVPDRLSPSDAKLLATKLALARILATVKTPTPPKTMPTTTTPRMLGPRLEDGRNRLGPLEISGVSGQWTTT